MSLDINEITPPPLPRNRGDGFNYPSGSEDGRDQVRKINSLCIDINYACVTLRALGTAAVEGEEIDIDDLASTTDLISREIERRSGEILNLAEGVRDA